MQGSVNQIFMTKAEPPPLAEKSKYLEAPRQIKGKTSFKHQLRDLESSHKQSPQKAGKQTPLEDQTEPAALEANQAQAVVKDVMCNQLPAVAETVPEQIPEDIKAPTQQVGQPILEAVTATLSTLPPVRTEAGQTAEIIPPAEINTGVAAAQAAEQLADTELGVIAPDKEQPDGKHSEENSTSTDRFKLMFRENRNHVLLKLTIDSERTQPTSTAEQAPGQAKKLLEFENHRLAAIQLPQEAKTAQESTAAEVTPQVDPDLVINARETPGGIRIMARSSEFSASAAQQPVQPDELFDQIVERAKLMVKMNGAEMKIDLKPDSLGKLSIKVMFEDGLVTARFVTDNHQVKQMLESNLSTLRHNLENQGIKVDRTEVEVQVGNQPDFGASNWNRESWGGQPGSKHKPVVLDENDVSVEVETAILSSPVRDAWYGYSADGGMNLLV